MLTWMPFVRRLNRGLTQNFAGVYWCVQLYKTHAVLLLIFYQFNRLFQFLYRLVRVRAQFLTTVGKVILTEQVVRHIHVITHQPLDCGFLPAKQVKHVCDASGLEILRFDFKFHRRGTLSVQSRAQ